MDYNLVLISICQQEEVVALRFRTSEKALHYQLLFKQKFPSAFLKIKENVLICSSSVNPLSDILEEVGNLFEKWVRIVMFDELVVYRVEPNC
jgi:hypothetical protein